MKVGITRSARTIMGLPLRERYRVKFNSIKNYLLLIKQK